MDHGFRRGDGLGYFLRVHQKIDDFLKVLRRPVKYLEGAGRAFNIIACIAVIAMMLLSTADVVMRLFGKPIPGTYELVGFLGAIVVSFALVFTSMEKGHIAVEILVEKLPQRAQLSIEAVCNLIGALLFGVIAYQVIFNISPKTIIFSTWCSESRRLFLWFPSSTYVYPRKSYFCLFLLKAREKYFHI